MDTPTSSSDGGRALIRASAPHAKLYPSVRFVSPLVYQPPDDIVPVLQTMSFFELFTCSTVTSTTGLGVFHKSILALSHQRDYLMHSMLGMAAAHLADMHVISADPGQLRRFRKTELYHWQQAIRLYRAELTHTVEADHMDSLITTCMLLSIHNFYCTDANEKSFVNVPRAQRPEALRWLTVPLGFRVVLDHVQPFLTASAWFGLLTATAPEESVAVVEESTLATIRLQFLELCDVTDGVLLADSPIHQALTNLFALVQIDRLGLAHFAELMAFMGRLAGPFQKLLIGLDKRALMIILYWMVLLDRLDLWWARIRIVKESRAIIDHLGRDSDQLVQCMLELPRSALSIR